MIGDKWISESDIIVWLLSEEYKTGTELIPKDNYQKLQMRWFLKDATTKFIKAFMLPKE